MLFLFVIMIVYKRQSRENYVTKCRTVKDIDISITLRLEWV